MTNIASQWFLLGYSPGDLGKGLLYGSYKSPTTTCPNAITLAGYMESDYPPSNYPKKKVMNLIAYRSCSQGSTGCNCIYDEFTGIYECRASCGTSYFVSTGPDVIASFSNLYGATPSSYTNKSVVPEYEQVTSPATPGTPTKPGYDFNGWNPTLPTYISVNTNFAAQWSAKEFTLSFDSNLGGTPSPTFKRVTYAQQYGELATVYRSGYSLNGWFTASSGGVKVTPTTVVTATTDHSIYAQ